MSLFEKFQQFISTENLFSPKDTLLLAVSGGIDSVVLCQLCQQGGYDFVLAHCNFQLRGEESERDEQFVRQLAEKYGKPILAKRFDTRAYAAAHAVSVQVAARDLRYDWFRDIVTGSEPLVDSQSIQSEVPGCTTHDSRLTAIVTAHHLDDNIETLLMNFFKGTGIAGLRGILPKQGKIIRPLLFAKKEAIRQFAEQHQLAWVEDSSNQLDKYARNYFRHQLIPLVKNLYPEAENNLAHNIDRFRDIELLYQQAITQHKTKLLELRGNEIHIPVLKLLKAVPLYSVVYEIIKDYQFSPQQAEEVIGLLSSDTGKYVQSATHRVIKNRNWLIIAPKQTSLAGNILIEGPGALVFGNDGSGGSFELKSIPGLPLKMPAATEVALLDAGRVFFPLLLRKWKTGDYFYPLGMKKKKKIARFLIDQKLSKTEKEKVWVLESNKKIIWVVGHRIDDRFKITPHTKNTWQFTLKAFNV